MEAILWSMETILRHAEAVCDPRKLLPHDELFLPHIKPDHPHGKAILRNGEPDYPYSEPNHRNGKRLLQTGCKN